MDVPLLKRPLSGAQRARARRRWRAAIANAASDVAAAKLPTELAPPRTDAALQRVRFFLPKTLDGRLLQLGCADHEFDQHVGVGVALYMRFVKNTGYLFVAASLIAVPQLVANASGDRLHLRWPWSSACDALSPAPSDGATTSSALPTDLANLQRLAMQGGQALLYGLFSTLLGNASLGDGSAARWCHVIAAPAVCALFCIYVYWVWDFSNSALAQIDAASTRASDFAVRVEGLPSAYTDQHAVRAHFAFFGPVASVSLAVDNENLLLLLERQHRLQHAWRQLHLRHALLPADQRKRCRGSHLRAAEKMLVALARAREELRAETSAPCACTGDAFVVFRRQSDATRCVRHFELIRRYLRSRDGIHANVDFRQLYFRTAHKLEVYRACEPSDVIWRNLRYSRATQRTERAKTSLLVFSVSCVSTIGIAFANFMGTAHSSGPLTTLWVTAVVIGSNVCIFSLVPHLAIHSERHHYRSSQHLHMLLKMAFFQIFNTSVSVLAFLYLTWEPPETVTCPLPPATSPRTCVSMVLGVGGGGGGGAMRTLSSLASALFSSGIDARCVGHWYTTGALVLLNGLFGDLAVILALIEFVRPEKVFARKMVAPHAATQEEMNECYEVDGELFLPFRYQLVLKVVFLTAMFCPAVPLLLPFAALFMFCSYRVDRYNLLRVMKPPPRTTDRTITLSVLYMLPLAVVAHVWMAVFFYSKQAGVSVPIMYYLMLATLGIYLMARITSTLSRQHVRPLDDMGSELFEQLRDSVAEPSSEGAVEGGAGGAAAASAGVAAAGAVRTGGCSGGSGDGGLLEGRELYVPPLTNALLEALLSESHTCTTRAAIRDDATGRFSV